MADVFLRSTLFESTSAEGTNEFISSGSASVGKAWTVNEQSSPVSDSEPSTVLSGSGLILGDGPLNDMTVIVSSTGDQTGANLGGQTPTPVGAGDESSLAWAGAGTGEDLGAGRLCPLILIGDMFPSDASKN